MSRKTISMKRKEYCKQWRRDNPRCYTATIAYKRSLKIKAIEYKGGICSSCGCNGNPAIFDFHHIDPTTKTKNLKEFYKWDLMAKELDKCILLCSNCHRTLHNKELENVKKA